jgi:hypothetical protein
MRDCRKLQLATSFSNSNDDSANAYEQCVDPEDCFESTTTLQQVATCTECQDLDLRAAAVLLRLSVFFLLNLVSDRSIVAVLFLLLDNLVGLLRLGTAATSHVGRGFVAVLSRSRALAAFTRLGL